MRGKLYFTVATVILLGSVTSTAGALSFKGFKPLKVFEKAVTAPAKTIVAATKVVVHGDSVGTILDPAKDVAASVSSVPKIAVSVATWPHEQMYKAAKSAAVLAGKPGEFFFDVATFADQYHQQLIKTTGEIAANTLLGENPLQFIAMPLAAAIHEARERHLGNARPLPDDVKKGLASFFSPEILARAKYTIGTAEITLPNGIGKTQKLFGADYAVTVDDVIVFNKDPGAFADSPSWWAHEVLHTQQYAQWGVESFAFKYVQSVSSVENPAEERGAQVRAWAENNWPGMSHAKISVSHMVVGAESFQEDTLVPAAYVKLKQEQATRVAADPIIIRCIFPGDPNQYFGTKAGRLIVKDPHTQEWMQIGWAVPPDIPGPSWIYLIPGGVVYDAFPNGDLIRRPPMGPYGPLAPTYKVGFFSRSRPQGTESI